MKRPRFWIDGEIVEDAALPADDRALLYGDGLFETILVAGGRAIWLSEHLARFRRSARELGFPGPDALAQAGARAARDLVKETSAARAALRITWTRGPGAGGFAPPGKPQPHVFARLSPLPTKAAADVRAVFYPDLHAGSMAVHKTCSSMTYVEAIRRARTAGADEALVSDGQGGIAEATAANVFAIVDGVLRTPPVRLPLLPGITRAWVLRQAATLRMRVRDQALPIVDLERAEEAFLTGSVAGVVPLTSVDGHAIANGRPGIVTRRFAAAFAEETS